MPTDDEFREFIKISLMVNGADYLEKNSEVMVKKLGTMTKPITEYLNKNTTDNHAIEYAVIESIINYLNEAKDKILDAVVENNKDKVALIPSYESKKSSMSVLN